MPAPWIVKYRPKKPEDIVGQREPVAAISLFLQHYSKQKKRALLLHGPPGTGKTSAVYAVSAPLELEVLEVNASDFRNRDKIERTIGNASRQRPLFARAKLILVDEIDGLSGTHDRGGIQALLEVIKKSAHPMVLTAQNPYENKFSKIRSASTMAGFMPLGYLEIFARLKHICNAEGISHDDMALKSLARRAGGDLRAAINDLQSLSHGGTFGRIDLENLSEREQTSTIVEALVKIFKTSDPLVAKQALDQVNEDYDQVMLWLDENLPEEYRRPGDLARAYDCLSKADVFRRRIRRWQHWRFLVYINALLSAGVASAKDEKYRDFNQYKPTGRLLKVWMANQRLMKKKAIAEKVAELTHTSSRRALKDTVPYLQHIFRRNKKQAAAISSYLDLGKDETAWLCKT